jgi:hypothetical protein
MTTTLDTDIPPDDTLVRRHRPRTTTGRHARISLRLADDEYADLVAAAGRFALTPAGYAAEVTIAATRGNTPDQQPDTRTITHAELARLHHELFATRTAINHLAAQLPPAPQDAPPDDHVLTRQNLAALGARLDEITDRLHRQLPPARRRARPHEPHRSEPR